MPVLRYGGREGKALRLQVSRDMVAVRTVSRAALAPAELGAEAREAVAGTTTEMRLPAAGVEVLRMLRKRGAVAARDRARVTLAAEPDVEFAGRVLEDAETGVPVLYTENLFVRFGPDVAPSACLATIARHELLVKREIPYLRNGYFVGAPEGAGMAVFDLADDLLDDPEVELAHPELVWEGSRRTVSPFQWHLGPRRFGEVDVEAHAHVEAAWETTRGEGTVIAVIDDGFDLDHEELSSPGKVVAPFDATERTSDPRPGAGDHHGTACAGIACADGLQGAAGVAPRARLLPVRLISGLGSQDEADAIVWAAEHGADVLSCSWGPEDGDPRNPDDPRHLREHPLPDSTRVAIEWATEHGRGGRGCVVVWAAGNGDESADLDGYAANPRVIAVAACNDGGKRSAYSDHGKAVWCCFPSHDFGERPTPGIWTTDRGGRSGYNPGRSTLGDRRGFYTNRFTGTSASTPGVAGVAALVLAVAPHLGWSEVKDLLARTAEPIDEENGAYENGRSDLYGHGRVHAARAVEAALASAREAAAAAPVAPPVAAPAGPPRAIAVQVETTAEEVVLTLDGRPFPLVDGVARTVLPAGERFALGWMVSGAPGTPYRISVTAEDAAVNGSFPVERRISAGASKAAGSRLFSLQVNPPPAPAAGDTPVPEPEEEPS